VMHCRTYNLAAQFFLQRSFFLVQRAETINLLLVFAADFHVVAAAGGRFFFFGELRAC
jgi:hypothetical protein